MYHCPKKLEMQFLICSKIKLWSLRTFIFFSILRYNLKTKQVNLQIYLEKVEKGRKNLIYLALIIIEIPYKYIQNGTPCTVSTVLSSYEIKNFFRNIVEFLTNLKTMCNNKTSCAKFK